jgi:pimeloyl-ACP methyl ester carboxylesterase
MLVCTSDVEGTFDTGGTGPALVVWGRRDRVILSASAERGAAILPQSSLCLIDQCGHYPHWEQPGASAAAVEEILLQ